MLQVSGADYTVNNQLLPLINRCRQEFEVEIACAAGPDSERLSAMGYTFHDIPFARSHGPLGHLRALGAIYRLLRRERFQIIHTHTPIAAALTRVAAWLARVPLVVNTAHGFYFHEQMPRLTYSLHLGLEWFLGRLTDFSFFQSREDYETAVRNGICSPDTGLWISNGIDLGRFDPSRPDLRRAGTEVRAILGAGGEDVVICTVARLVREKGLFELLSAFEQVAQGDSRVHLLIIGPEQDGDRDGVLAAIRSAQQRPDWGGRLHYAGYQTDIAPYLAAAQIFTLPSYREGMPRTIIEAMAMGLPVVATDIRGCREEVVPEETGLLVPPGTVEPLTAALRRLALDSGLRRSMGEQARARCLAHYDEAAVLERQVTVLRRLTR